MALVRRAPSHLESEGRGVGGGGVHALGGPPLEGGLLALVHFRDHPEKFGLALAGRGVAGAGLGYEDVVLEEADAWFLALGLEHSWLRSESSTSAVGQSAPPLSLVCALVSPPHLALALPHVLAELPTVDVAVGPAELAPPVLAVGAVVAMVFVAALAGPPPLTLAYALPKFAGVSGAGSPAVLAVAVWAAGLVVATIRVTVGEGLDAVALLDKLGEGACVFGKLPW